jgi:2,4-didehydro-3-deoxy-L-rhamnonate hydrolase
MKSLIARSAAATAVLLLGWLLAWAVASRIAPPARPLPDAPPMPADLPSRVAIASRDDALTFARFERHGRLRLLLVSAYDDDHAVGIDLTDLDPTLPAEPIGAFAVLGYDALRQLSGPEVRVPAQALRLPFDGTAVQVAAGINYPEHGREVGVDESFLFPKISPPGHFLAPVAARGDTLLDHEIELGFVALAPLRAGPPPRHVGLVLASDYTDRARLMRHIDLGHIASGRGFTGAKSASDFMPVGPLFVIPSRPEAFYRSLRLQLWVNGRLRQVAEPCLLAWDWPRILEETHRRQALRWQVDGRDVALPVERGEVPAGTVFLSGTPDGVVFREPSARQIFLGVTELIFTLRWNDPQAVVEPLIRESHRSREYLHPGDTVVMHADRLGVIRNTIVAAAPAVAN